MDRSKSSSKYVKNEARRVMTWDRESTREGYNHRAKSNIAQTPSKILPPRSSTRGCRTSESSDEFSGNSLAVLHENRALAGNLAVRRKNSPPPGKVLIKSYERDYRATTPVVCTLFTGCRVIGFHFTRETWISRSFVPAIATPRGSLTRRWI